jgi:hypothetical protein
MKIFLSLALGVVSQIVMAMDQEQYAWHQHDYLETRKVVEDDETEKSNKIWIGPLSIIAGTLEYLKQSGRGARRLRPKFAKSTKSSKDDRSRERSITLPNRTFAPTPEEGSPTSAPSDERSTRDPDYFVNLPNGFLCDPPVPFFMDLNVNPSTALNGQSPQLIPNGFNPNCTLRMLPNTPANVSTSAVQNLTLNPENAEMQSRIQVGKFEFVLFLLSTSTRDSLHK